MSILTLIFPAILVRLVAGSMVNVVLDGKRHTLESVSSTKDFAEVLKQYVAKPEEAIIYHKNKLMDLGTYHKLDFEEDDHVYIYSNHNKDSTPQMDIFGTLFKAYMNSQFSNDKGKYKNKKDKTKNNKSGNGDQLYDAFKTIASSSNLWNNIMKYATPENMEILKNVLQNAKSNLEKEKFDNLKYNTPDSKSDKPKRDEDL